MAPAMMLDVVVCVLFVLFGVGAIVLGVTNGGIWLALSALGVLLLAVGAVGGVLAARGRMHDRGGY